MFVRSTWTCHSVQRWWTSRVRMFCNLRFSMMDKHDYPPIWLRCIRIARNDGLRVMPWRRCRTSRGTTSSGPFRAGNCPIRSIRQRTAPGLCRRCRPDRACALVPHLVPASDCAISHEKCCGTTVHEAPIISIMSSKVPAYCIRCITPSSSCTRRRLRVSPVV